MGGFVAGGEGWGWVGGGAGWLGVDVEQGKAGAEACGIFLELG